MKRFSAIIFVFLLTNCVTDEGHVPKSDSQTGNIIIRVNQSLQADIYLDYRKTGLHTPTDVLSSIPSGRHVIHLKLANYHVEPDSHVVDLADSQTADIQFQLTSVASGNLSVSTNPFTGVYLDRVLLGYANQQGKFLFNGIPAGDHIFGLKKSAYYECNRTLTINAGSVTSVDRTLISAGVIPAIEHFSNISCVPCPATDNVLESVLSDFGISKVISIGYHTSSPSNNDPMYWADTSANNSRIRYYSIVPIPSVVLNGKKIVYGNNTTLLNDSLRSKISFQYGKNPLVSIQIQPAFTADFNTISGVIQIEIHEAICNQSKLRIALIERSVDFNQSPGTNGMTHFFDVMRAFYPSPEGTAINTSAGQISTVNYSFTRQSGWGYDLHVVAFVQDDDTKSIYQSAWTLYP